MSRHLIIPIFVPHFGCPHDCVFCNQKKITNFSTNVSPEDVKTIIDSHLAYAKKDMIIEVAFYGGSFTAIDIEVQRRLLEIPLKYKNENIINEIRLSTRPDAIDDIILNHLKDFKVNTIELGVQSMDNDVLIQSGRGHNVEDVYRASSLIKEYGFNLGLQMMIGLPGDNFKKSLNTVKQFINLNPSCVRIYPTLVIKDTFLEKNYFNDKYKPLSINQAIDISTVLLMLFYINDINVIRVGLQPTENIQLGKDVVAGPFHPAFRQLVETNIYKILLEYYFKNKVINKSNEILVIETRSKNISNIAGQKGSNKNYFKEKYGFSKVKIFQKEIDLDYICITIGNFYDKINMKSLMETFILNNPL